MKNPLSDIYEQMLLTEAEKHALQNPSHDEIGSIKAKQDLFGEKPKPVEGPDKAKVKEGPKYTETTGTESKPSAKSASQPNSAPAKSPKTEEGKEMKDTDVNPKKEEEEEDKKDKKKEQKNEGVSLSSFEALFKKTIVEELNEQPTPSLETENSEEPVLDEEPALEGEEENEGEEEEEGDLISDLKELQTKLADILAKLEDVSEESEEEGASEEYSDEDFDQEFGDEEEQNPVKEAMEKPKVLDSSKGKTLMSKKNKVGNLNPKKSKSHTGSLNCEPDPIALGDKKGSLQKGKPEVRSTIKKGDFIK